MRILACFSLFTNDFIVLAMSRKVIGWTERRARKTGLRKLGHATVVFTFDVSGKRKNSADHMQKQIDSIKILQGEKLGKILKK